MVGVVQSASEISDSPGCPTSGMPGTALNRRKSCSGLDLVARGRCKMNNRRPDTSKNKHITEVTRDLNERQMNADHCNRPPKGEARRFAAAEAEASAAAEGTPETILKYFTDLFRRLEAVEARLDNLRTGNEAKRTEASLRTPQELQRYQQTNCVFHASNACRYGTRC